jgi:hypothetical protein
MYNLAIDTASYRERAIKPDTIMQKIVSMVRTYAVPFEKMERQPDGSKVVMAMKISRQRIRNDDRNRPGCPIAQFQNDA